MVQFSLIIGNSLPVYGIHLEEEMETCMCAFSKPKNTFIISTMTTHIKNKIL
jgi:hypothetical protein